MHRHGIPPLKKPGLEAAFKKLEVDAGSGWSHDRFTRCRIVNGLRRGDRELRVLTDIGRRFPKFAIRFVPDFPEDSMALEVSGCGGCPPGERLTAFRRKDRLVWLVKWIAIIEDKHQVQLVSLECSQ